MALVILDAGHGGSDLGSVNDKRYEKNDNLKLTLTVGSILEGNNINVYYTRTDDSFDSQVDRVNSINEVKGDLLVSIHRGFSSMPNTESGARAYLEDLEKAGVEITLANNILKALVRVGFKNNGITERWYYLLTNTDTPGIVLLVGYITSDYDNQLYDSRFFDTAYAIANGIMETLKTMGVL